MTIEHPRLVERNGKVQRRLAAEPSEQPLWLFALNDPLDHLNGERFEIYGVGNRRVGHDRRRIGVHEDRANPFGAERATRLRPRVVKLRRLADHHRP